MAALRAEFERPRTTDGDPEAQRALARGMRASGGAGRRRRLLARTRFFDQAVLDALGAGIDQVVIVGAGYDDRALRFRAPGVTFFELDHPATQADKRRRLRGRDGGPVLAALDLRSGGAGRVLAAAGHVAGRPSLFVCEGLLVYLDREAIERLLRELAARASENSLLAASLATHPPRLDSAAVAARANGRRRFGASEPWLTILPVAGWLALLRAAGWREERMVDPPDLVPGAPAGRSALVLARPAGASRPAGPAAPVGPAEAA